MSPRRFATLPTPGGDVVGECATFTLRHRIPRTEGVLEGIPRHAEGAHYELSPMRLVASTSVASGAQNDFGIETAPEASSMARRARSGSAFWQKVSMDSIGTASSCLSTSIRVNHSFGW